MKGVSVRENERVPEKPHVLNVYQDIPIFVHGTHKFIAVSIQCSLNLDREGPIVVCNNLEPRFRMIRELFDVLEAHPNKLRRHGPPRCVEDLQNKQFSIVDAGSERRVTIRLVPAIAYDTQPSGTPSRYVNRHAVFVSGSGAHGNP